MPKMAFSPLDRKGGFVITYKDFTYNIKNVTITYTFLQKLQKLDSHFSACKPFA